MSIWHKTLNVVVALSTATLLGSCSGRRPTNLSHQDVEELNHYAGSAVEETTQRAIVSPDRESEMRTSRAKAALTAGEPIWIQSGKSRVLQLPAAVKRVSIGDPGLAGVVVLGPRTLMVNAKELPRGQVAVAPAAAVGRGLVTAQTMTPPPRVSETTFVVWYGNDLNPDVHTLFVADFIDQQVLLEVTVAEINRTAIEQHGIDFRAAKNSFLAAYFMGGGVGPAPAGGSSLVPSGGAVTLPLGTATDAPVFAFVLPNEDITGFIQAMQRDGFARVLAQPKMVAMSGQNAVFQVGGEIPIRIATGFATDIEFKPFGTIVNFIPRVSDEGDIILTVTPEVSQVDFNSLVEGVPTFRTRRASTSTRLRNGQTMVLGGLMQTNIREEITGIPYLKDIPVVGYVFRKSNYSDEVTELVVVVTPHLVQPLPAGTQVALPTDRGPLTNEEIRDRPHPAEATRPRIPGLP